MSEEPVRMRLLIVVVNYKVTDLTIDCLRSVAREIGSAPGSQVAVCENGTGEADGGKLQEAIDSNGWAGWCKLTAVMPNRGFTGGNNVVLREAMASADKPQYVL